MQGVAIARCLCMRRVWSNMTVHGSHREGVMSNVPRPPSRRDAALCAQYIWRLRAGWSVADVPLVQTDTHTGLDRTLVESPGNL